MVVLIKERTAPACSKNVTGTIREAFELHMYLVPPVRKQVN